ncbi:GCN5 family acetyltransferase [Paenibacillus sp. P3E]|uniref:GNAT family N-acetyltransferase n=1 Tax=unclassified Paenibacillus TaxID=185978 RepID=UPI000939D969|nr:MULTISPECIES: GNAT family N-acetyltransferase [unclassified Paenibacillus]OKP80027.1 GCN5 family acetyltransferase [Paenibacillus sp. P3E]OKP82558.1 GCN5 family acetyltransferase [Paenibacillus sp. P32E]
MTEVSQLSINSLTQDNIQSVLQLFKASISDAFEQEGLGHLQEDIQHEVEKKKLMAEASLDSKHSDPYFLVAQLDGAVVGTISFAPCGEDIQSCTGHQLDDVGELGSLYILPRYQGQGVGSALIKELMAYLRKQGLDQFCLDSGYTRAQTRWLQKFGEPYITVKDYWGPDSVHMVWLCKVSDFS